VFSNSTAPSHIVAPHDESTKALTSNPSQLGSHQEQPQKPFPNGLVDRTINDPVALFTLALVVSTILLWRATLRLASEARTASLDQAEKTERSIEAAAKSAQAATEQVKIVQDTAYRELRAYISVDDVSVVSVRDGEFDGTITIHNAGATPAQIEVYLTGWIGDFPTPKPRDLGSAPYRAANHRSFLNRNGVETIQWFYPTTGADKPGMAAIVAKPSGVGAKAFYLYGRVEFTDFQRRRRIIHFSFRNNAVPKVGSKFKMCPTIRGNDYEDLGTAV